VAPYFPTASAAFWIEKNAGFGFNARSNSNG
jgi:hypothetical protein